VDLYTLYLEDGRTVRLTDVSGADQADCLWAAPPEDGG
jgi:hypothetical protein